MNRSRQPSAATAGRFPFAAVCTSTDLPIYGRAVFHGDPMPTMAERLDDLMRRCREEHHTPTYADLQALKGGA